MKELYNEKLFRSEKENLQIRKSRPCDPTSFQLITNGNTSDDHELCTFKITTSDSLKASGNFQHMLNNVKPVPFDAMTRIAFADAA